jgi:hypothetical protein
LRPVRVQEPMAEFVSYGEAKSTFMGDVFIADDYAAISDPHLEPIKTWKPFGGNLEVKAFCKELWVDLSVAGNFKFLEELLSPLRRAIEVRRKGNLSPPFGLLL